MQHIRRVASTTLPLSTVIFIRNVPVPSKRNDLKINKQKKTSNNKDLSTIYRIKTLTCDINKDDMIIVRAVAAVAV